MSMNKAILFGNVGADPEIRMVNDAKVASFRIATSDRYKDRNGELHENTEWHSIVCWRNLADTVEKFVHKGDQILVEGSIKYKEYTNQSGEKKTQTNIVASSINLTKGSKQNQSNAQDTAEDSDDIPF